MVADPEGFLLTVCEKGYGKRTLLEEFRIQSGLPAFATRGGADTMYPEFQVKLKK